jgi:hypothetical protein
MKYIGNNLKVSDIDQYAGEVSGIVESFDGNTLSIREGSVADDRHFES